MSSFDDWAKKYQFYIDKDAMNAIELAVTHMFNTNRTIMHRVGTMDLKRDFSMLICPQLLTYGVLAIQSYWLFYDGMEESQRDADMKRMHRQYRGFLNDHKVLVKQVLRENGLSDADSMNMDRVDDKLDLLGEKIVHIVIKGNQRYAKIFKEVIGNYKAQEQVLTLERLYEEVYRMADQDDQGDVIPPFLEVSQQFAELHKNLASKVLCQDAAVSKFVQGMFAGKLKDVATRKGPEACFLFVGPPGVGKTYLAENAGNYLDRPFKLFQMNEYSAPRAHESLVGFASTFTNSKDGELTEFVEENPDAILVFDEIEKAHPDVMRLFLSILEGGFLHSIYREADVDFSRTVIIFTTNAGREFYEDNKEMSVSSLSEATIMDALKKDKDPSGNPLIPTELLSRLAKGYIVGFDHMNPAKLVPMIKAGMKSGKEIIEQKFDFTCQYDESSLPYLFLYHLGSQLDARVATSRSKSFILDTFYSIAKRAGQTPERYQDRQQIDFQVVDSEPLAQEFLVPERKSNVIMVSYRRDRDLVTQETDRYVRFDAWDTSETEEGRQSKITSLMEENEIDAILVDPFFAIIEAEDEGDGFDEMEGVIHMNSRGNNVLRWLLKQKNMPPVYILEIGHRISLVDRIELQRLGVKGFLNFIGKETPECTQLVDELTYELFLGKKVDVITSKGRALDYDIGQTITENGIDVKLFNFKLVNNMTTDAADVTISEADKPEVTFADVIGAESAKEEMRSFVKFLKNPDEFLKSGMQVSKGILLYGPAGTGKTKLAKALASEADCPFIATTGAQFVNGQKKISEVFRLARKYAPSVVFIDEIDSFALSRGSTDSGRATLVNDLLTEMDGFETKAGKPVFVVAATNMGSAPDLNGTRIYLDKALLRRFSKKVFVDIPDKENRLEFMKRQREKYKNKKYNLNQITDEQLEDFAKHTTGSSLAELENVLNLLITRSATLEQEIDSELLVEVYDETKFGERMKVSVDSFLPVSIHEAGHALLGFIYKDQPNPQYATIVGRANFLGMVEPGEREDAINNSKLTYLHRIRVILAGRCAEQVMLGEKGITDGASNDLWQATRIAELILSQFGMEKGFLPAIEPEKMMASPLAQMYYEKLNEIIEREMDETIKELENHKKQLEDLARALFEKSRLTESEMRQIIGMEEE